MSYFRRLLNSFTWLKQPYQWLFLTALLGFSLALGVLAHQKPLDFHPVTDGNDGQFMFDVNGGSLQPGAGARVMRGHTLISIPGLSAAHPYTLTMFLGADTKYFSSRPYFTIIVNGYRYPSLPITAPSFHSWRIDKTMIVDGRLDVLLSAPTYLNVIWNYSLLIGVLHLEPATDPGQTIADYAELDWGNVACLAAIVLLTYSFFAGARQRWVVIAWFSISLLLLLKLYDLLATDRPLFVVYASSLVAGLALLRLALPLVGNISRPHPILWLFLLPLSSALLLTPPDIQDMDNYYKYLVAQSLLLRGTVQLPPPIMDLGSHYTRYLLGHSIAELPLLSLGWLVQQLTNAPALIQQSFVNLLSPIISALGVVLLFLCARRMFGSERLAVSLSLIYFFATFVFSYAVQDWSEPLLTTLLLFAFYTMLRTFAPNAADRGKWLLLAGFTLGYMIFTKEEYIIVAAIFGLWWLLRRGSELRHDGVITGSMLRTLLFEGMRLATPIVVFYSLNLSYNLMRYGVMFGSGYVESNILAFNTPLITGLYGLLFSSGKGLLVFAPPLLLCIWAGQRFWQSYPWETALIGALFGVLLIFYSLYVFWDGANSWGPRFLLPFVPLLVLVSGAALQHWGDWLPWQRWGYGGLVAVGTLFNFAGAITALGASWAYGYANQGFDIWTELVRFSPSFSEITHALDMVGRGYLQSEAVFQLSAYHFAPFINLLVPAGLIALTGLSGWQIAHIYQARQEADVAAERQVAHLTVEPALNL